jgi:hypothetical protein
MTGILQPLRWFDDPAEVVTFGRALYHAGGIDDDPDDAFDYIERPWKWDPEHDAWVDYGRPAGSDQSGWGGFIHEVERRR